VPKPSRVKKSKARQEDYSFQLGKKKDKGVTRKKDVNAKKINGRIIGRKKT